MKNVIVIGNLSYNINLFLNSFLIEGLEYSLTKKSKTLGNILNISSLLSKYDLDVYYFSCVGDDYEGKEIINNLHSNKIHSDYVNIINNTKTNKNYIIRNLKNNSKTIIYERNINKYELLRDITFNTSVIYTSSNYELTNTLKFKTNNSKIVFSLNNIDEETLKIAKISDYIIIPVKYAEILSNTKLNRADKNSIINLYTLVNKLFSGKIIVYDELIGSIYEHNNRLNLVPKLGSKEKIKENSLDVYKATFIYGIANNYNLDKTIKISCISKFLYDNDRNYTNIREVLKIYDENN